MKQPSREILENAKTCASIEHGDYVCSGISCIKCIAYRHIPISGQCTYKYNSSFFRDALENYTTMERIDTMNTEKEIEALKARIARLEGKQKTTYPCIKRATDGMIVLFTGPNTGTMICSNGISGLEIGNNDNCWTESEFTETLREYTIKV